MVGRLPPVRRLAEALVLWRELNQDSPQADSHNCQLDQRQESQGSPTSTTNLVFPSPGLVSSWVRRSALQLAALMETYSFLNLPDTFIRVLCDQPTDLAERQLSGEGPRRGQEDVFGGPGRKSEEAS